MTTTVYKNLRATIQLISVVLIIINIPLIVMLVYNMEMSNVENYTLKLGYTSLTNMYKLIIICNITLGMFASCGINSKVKMYMKFYLLFTFLYLVLFVACILYVRNAYLRVLINTFNTKMATSLSYRYLLQSTFECSMMNGTCDDALKRSSFNLIRFFLVISYTSLVLHLLSFVFIKVAINVRIEKPQIKLPKIITITKAGMNTQSLRQKQIVAV